MKQTDYDYKDESILIVDDDPTVNRVLEDLLSALTFSVTSATSGPEAIEKINEKEFTFILVDMKMPDMDGFELIERVGETSPDLSIIAMTGYTDEYRYVDIINAGASDFIKKPIQLQELEAKIRRIINERNLRKELSRLSITDSLTGLYNQRYFYKRLKEEVVRARRQKTALSLILLDLDNFKAFNDSHGHLAGDQALRNAGRLIHKSIRQGVDSGYRYGGDEFAIILIDADTSIAREIGKRIDDSFKADGTLAASMGFVKYSESMSIKDFVANADRELYRAKEGGKNR
ncbi:MAG: diguanylate cyclase [Deltaproteobacteria bacterium]|jgi:two-component system cell cycle response regulator